MESQQDITKELSKQITQDAKNIKKIQSIAFDLAMKIALAPGKGNILEYIDGDTHLLIDIKMIRSINCLFEDFARSLPNKLKDLKRKKKTFRAKLKPDSLRNVYIPVFVTEPLRRFFMKNPQGFGGALNDKISENFARGYMLRMTINTLFHLYANQNKLQDSNNKQYINFDSHMRKCFAETQVGFVNVTKGDKKVKVPAEEVGVEESTVDVIRKQESSIQDIIDGKRKPISKNGCYTFHFYSITSYNCCSVNSIEKFQNPSAFKKEFENLQNIDVQKEMLSDFANIKRVSDDRNPKLTAKRIAAGIKSPTRSPNRSPARSPSKNGGVKSPSRLTSRIASPTQRSTSPPQRTKLQM